MVGKLHLKSSLQLFPEEVDPSPWQFVVKVAYEEIQRYLNFQMHFGISLLSNTRLQENTESLLTLVAKNN